MATLGEWLIERRADVPDTLWKKLEACFPPVDVNAEHALAQLTAAADGQLEQMRTRTCAERADAHDLLATDALITYVLELAATQGTVDLDSFAGDVLCMVAGGARPAALDS